MRPRINAFPQINQYSSLIYVKYGLIQLINTISVLKMEIRDLQTFIAVAETGSVTKAAQLLGRSQPSVTRDIQDLESQIGFALLRRVGRRVMLSEEGVVFEEEARRVLESLTGLADRTRAIAAGNVRALKVVSTASIGAGLLPEALAQLSSGKQPTEIHVSQYTPNVVAQELSAGQAEIGYSSMPLDVPGLRVLRFYRAQSVAAIPADDPIAQMDVVPLSVFEGRRHTTMLDPQRFQGRVVRAMEKYDITHETVIRTNVSYTALRMVQQTGSLAILDPVSAYCVRLPGVTIRRIETDIPFYWGAFSATGRTLRPIAEALVEAVEATAVARIPGLKIIDPAEREAWLSAEDET